MRIQDIKIEITFSDKVIVTVEAKFDNMSQAQHFIDLIKSVIEKELIDIKFEELTKTKGAS